MNYYKKKYPIFLFLLLIILVGGLYRFLPNKFLTVQNDDFTTNRRVAFHQVEEVRFFAKHMALFVSVRDLKRVRDFVKESIQFERDLFDPFSPFKGKRLKEPIFDFEELFEKYIVLKPVKKLPMGYLLVEAETEEKARALKVEFEKNNEIESVKLISDFVPADQNEKVVILKEIRSLFSASVVKMLKEQERRGVEKFLKMEVFAPFTRADLPDSLRYNGNVVLVYPKAPLPSP